ncbi:MAG TPA: bifunctional phosphoribosylaminoimidazolecarboxamide formyltransferase/IMP cyclohydrolase [Pyrinomonadaceae bacterium]|jgi:phosphoribosylaminoimidazolecarboxamide formyltransferase/IMP cyclohydrolase|nr:bifunctional phosphoribosylaminoimidazolecarboxamide formyltransferase/IMP cyclohydrolase [Pyrinomonadaceae bacterium]
MTQEDELKLRKIKRAVVSVSDKTGIIDFVRALKEFGVEIISTGGTAKTLREAGLQVIDISDITGFPEMMDGRVKTLHPRVHGGLLALRDNPEHVAAMSEHHIQPIDMVVVNLYPFAETIRRDGVTREEAIEQIDIGGPAMIRSAAKNAQDVAVVISSSNYDKIINELKKYDGALSGITRRQLASDAFQETATYDAVVSAYLSGYPPPNEGGAITMFTMETIAKDTNINSETPLDMNADFSLETYHGSFPSGAGWSISKAKDLRYGENPHQVAALYLTSLESGLGNASVLWGKEMSFNNYIDADAAWQLVSDFEETACAIIKHTNPAGVGLGASTSEAYRRALATDPISAFGGIVAFNEPVYAEAAQELAKIFTEVVIAPDYSPEALEILQAKKNLRVLRMPSVKSSNTLEYRQISGGMLIQTQDLHQLRNEDLKVVTTRPPSDEETEALMFAWTVCKHTKSNAIVYARKDQTVGVGAGQMSRVDSVKIGAMRAQLPVAGSVLASDAFFPFRDGIDEAAKHGITAVIQPGGSVRDDEVVAAANEHGLAMVFTGIRHFKH